MYLRIGGERRCGTRGGGRMTRGPFDGKAVLTGAGKSQVGRRLGRTGLDLTLEAVLRAVSDAGLSVDDVDGIASYPGPGVPDAGFSGATVQEVRNALGLRSRWYMSAMETAGQIGPAIEACMAVSLGLANHVVVYRSVWESTAAQQAGGGRASVLFGGGELPPHLEWMAPFGALSAANWLAMPAQRYMHDFGLTREHLGQIAINARTNAGLNPDAVYREPMTMDDYLGARMISEPLCLYDCDVPCDGATAVIVSRRDATNDLPRHPLTVESVGPGMYERATWDQRADITTMAAHDSAATLWQHTTLTPSDVDMAQLYDGFSFLTVMWLEAMGFCDHGKVGEFLGDASGDGSPISLDGSLPINTSGGQLSGGRLHGMGFLHEACVQMWGEGGDRQAPKTPEVVAVGVGGGPVAGSMLLSSR
jgi:acetyl-CoA acetyltransferase